VHYPAIDIQSADYDVLYALLDDFAPTAIEEREGCCRAFFASPGARDGAMAALAARFRVQSVDVPDEDWARRSQQNLQPVTVGRITIYPNPLSRANPEPRIPNPDAISIAIAPSMGFGTGHHATTRLCVAALQTLDLRGRTVLDVGTGSGVLAIAASRLGAARVVGIDNDQDALQAARDNLLLNADAANVTLMCVDVGSERLPRADVVTANLTGALLVRVSAALLAAASPGACLILSGLMTDERDAVVRAFVNTTLLWERHEDEWVALSVKKP
jgi:ribosomal protein L11 methyltransferase